MVIISRQISGKRLLRLRGTFSEVALEDNDLMGRNGQTV